MTGVYRFFLLVKAFDHVYAVRYAVAVGYDEGGAVVGFRFFEYFDCVRVVGSESYFAYVYVAVAYGHHGKVFFAHAFAGSSKFGHRSSWGGFGHLSAGVGVDFGVED